MALRFTAAPADPALLRLPWSAPLRAWPAEQLVALPRGISRHVVRFVQVNDAVFAAKELPELLARREFTVLRSLERDREPAVRPVGVVTGRVSPDGEPLESVLVTRHLDFSLPYRLLFSRPMDPAVAERLVDALIILLVRLHVAGFWWGDCSLSNVLFRRDAGGFMAYLVDAETAEHHAGRLSDGQRAQDLDLARTNIAGELMDLAAGELLPDSVDPIATADGLVDRYQQVWDVLYGTERVPLSEPEQIRQRISQLNELGFDVEQLDMATDDSGEWLEVRPEVVEPDHHHRRLAQLTGLLTQENQARCLLADMSAFRVAKDLEDRTEAEVGLLWLDQAFRPTVAKVPSHLRRKLEPAELYLEVLQHRWALSPEAHNVSLDDALGAYIEQVLVHRPDEQAVLGEPVDTGERGSAEGGDDFGERGDRLG